MPSTAADIQDERQLIALALDGSRPAFSRIVELHQDRLLRFIMLRGLQQTDAEDVVQQAFVSAWQQLDSYRDQWRFSTWLYTIARRIVSKQVSSDGHFDDQHALPPVADSQLQQLLRDNLWSTARQQLSGLQFQALWLHYGEGFSGKEVARILQRSRIWVRVNLHRSKQLLQQAMALDTTIGPVKPATPNIKP